MIIQIIQILRKIHILLIFTSFDENSGTRIVIFPHSSNGST